jgi:multidrug resistance efflux pump
VDDHHQVYPKWPQNCGQSFPDHEKKSFNLADIANVDKSDVIAIVGARYEASARSAVSQATSALTKARSELSAAQAAYEKAYAAFAPAHPFAPPLEKLAQAFRELGFTSSFENSASYTSRATTTSWSLDHQAGAKTSDPFASLRVACELTVRNPANGNTHDFTSYINVDVPPALTALRLDVDRCTAAVTAAENVVVDARKALTNVNSVERQARAAIAVNALKATEEGARLLTELDSVTPMAMLPEATPAQRPNG